MAKLIILALGIWLLLTVLKGYKRSLDEKKAPAESPEDMVQCAKCGVHIPKSDSVQAHGQHFCCDEHANP